MANEKPVNVQDVFLNHVRKNKNSLTIFLINGVKLQGVVTWFDQATILLRREGHSQLVYKHAISTIMPQGFMGLFDNGHTTSESAPVSDSHSDDSGAAQDS